MDESKNYLGIDWGERKIGVALAHAETHVAMPYAIFPHDAELFSKLETLIAQEEVGTVVLGIPRYRGTGGTHPAQVWGEKLRQKLEIRVEYADEMFTTKLAQDTLKLLGGKVLGKHDDAEAAKILLQGWIDARAV